MNSLHEKLVSMAGSPSGFGVSELTGFSPEQVRRAAETLVKSGRLVRARVSPRRIRYFRDDDLARRYGAGRVAKQGAQASRNPSARAAWRAGEPAIITPKTRIYVAPPQPRDVYRTNTYPQF